MIKTITAYDETDFDAKVNKFNAENNCFATQTHVLRSEGLPTYFVAVMFYKSQQEIKDYNRS